MAVDCVSLHSCQVQLHGGDVLHCQVQLHGGDVLQGPAVHGTRGAVADIVHVHQILS